MNKNRVTMFSYSEIGKQLKKMWMSENIEILTKATIESNSDFALVLSEKELVMVRFIKLSEIEKYKRYTKDIINYVKKFKADDKMIIIFVNKNLSLSYYTLYKTII